MIDGWMLLDGDSDRLIKPKHQQSSTIINHQQSSTIDG
jgi:hypothetical protein